MRIWVSSQVIERKEKKKKRKPFLLQLAVLSESKVACQAHQKARLHNYLIATIDISNQFTTAILAKPRQFNAIACAPSTFKI